MSDMHVLLGAVDGRQWTVVMHIAVPVGNNDVGVSWATALLNSGRGGTTILLDGDGSEGTIDATEKSAIEAGTIFEHVYTFPVESGGTTTAELRTTLRSKYTQQKAVVQAEIQKQLRYYGHTEEET